LALLKFLFFLIFKNSWKRRSEKMDMKEKETGLLKALAVSWAIRATGKASHAGFNACMEEVKSIVPDSVWERYKMEMDTLHYHPGVERFILEVKKEIPKEVQKLIGGDMPSIDKIKRELKEI
jgi:fatty acid/phospholipid biosynthesis enzyme